MFMCVCFSKTQNKLEGQMSYFESYIAHLLAQPFWSTWQKMFSSCKTIAQVQWMCNSAPQTWPANQFGFQLLGRFIKYQHMVLTMRCSLVLLLSRTIGKSRSSPCCSVCYVLHVSLSSLCASEGD